MLRNAILFVAIFMSVRPEFSPEERQVMFLEIRAHTESCLKEYDMTFDEMVRKKAAGELDPCFLACTFKGSKVLNDKGMFDPEEAHKLTAKFAKNDETKTKFTEFEEICIAVNDKDVTDGDQGCERATLLLECFKEVMTSNS